MTDYAPLVTKWPTVAGSNDGEKLAGLNAEMITVHKSFTAGDVFAIIAAGSYPKIKITADDPTANASLRGLCIAAAALLADRNRLIDYRDDATRGQFQSAIGALLTAAMLTQAEHDAIDLLGSALAPWWQANGYTDPINQGDIEVAGLTGAQWKFTVTSVATDPISKNIVATVSFADLADGSFAPISETIRGYGLTNETISKWAAGECRKFGVRRAAMAAITLNAVSDPAP